VPLTAFDLEPEVQVGTVVEHQAFRSWTDLLNSSDTPVPRILLKAQEYHPAVVRTPQETLNLKVSRGASNATTLVTWC